MTLRGRVATACLAVAAASLPTAARAWKPYTHNYTGSQVLAGIDFGRSAVDIEGVAYPLHPKVSEAIAACTSCYHAGVVGPDGFPDLTYGQAVIHPDETGRWLQYLLDAAWAAQDDPSYSAWEKKQILAFTYGFMTHASGDVWGHTLVNEFAHGVFPGFGNILSYQFDAEIAVRHIIAEGQVGDATPGFDGNPDYYGPAPGGYGQVTGDESDKRTPGYPYAVPKRFIYQALVRDGAPTPTAAVSGNYLKARGPLVGGFLQLRDGLKTFVPIPPNPLDTAISIYNDVVGELNNLKHVCWDDFDWWDCGDALLTFGLDISWDLVDHILDFIWDETVAAAKAVLWSYIGAWIDDIESGLRDWADFGLALTQGLFDAQTRRDYQNEKCAMHDPGTVSRRTCEQGVGMLDVTMHQIEPFVMDHGASMLGAPDAAVAVWEIVSAVGDVLGDILAFVHIDFNPIAEAKEFVQDKVKELAKTLVAKALGIDIDTLELFLDHPGAFMCLSSATLTLPAPLGTVTLELFPNGEQQVLDSYMGFGMSDHEPVTAPGMSALCGRYRDSSTFDAATFGPIRNTITMGKLLLLDGPGMDGLLTAAMGRQIGTYDPALAGGSRPNVMTTALAGGPTSNWIKAIDGDHAWRADGRPDLDPRPSGAGHEDQVPGGHGNFPLWASCVLRPMHGALFLDWENPWTQVGADSWQGYGPPLGSTARVNFPELDDAVKSDEVNDPEAPASTLTPSGNLYVDGAGQLYAGPPHAFTLTAHDSPPGRAFRDDELQLRLCIAPGTGGCAWTDSGQGRAYSLPPPDGLYTIRYQSADACHGFAGPGTPEPEHALAVCRDTTAPVTSCLQPPFGLSFTPDQQTQVAVSFDDGYCGSGLKAASATIDGRLGESGPVPIALDGPVDLYWFLPGTRTVAVTASDHLDNGATTPCTFELHGTTGSLMPTLQRACREDSVDKHGICNSLMKKLEAAQAAHERGQHHTEHNILRAFTNELRAQGGKAVDALRAEWFIAFAQDIIRQGG